MMMERVVNKVVRIIFLTMLLFFLVIAGGIDQVKVFVSSLSRGSDGCYLDEIAAFDELDFEVEKSVFVGIGGELVCLGDNHEGVVETCLATDGGSGRIEDVAIFWRVDGEDTVLFLLVFRLFLGLLSRLNDVFGRLIGGIDSIYQD